MINIYYSISYVSLEMHTAAACSSIAWCGKPRVPGKKNPYLSQNPWMARKPRNKKLWYKDGEAVLQVFFSLV